MKKTLKRIALAVDSLFENFALISIASMAIIVAIQVITRKLFNFVFFWSEEVTLLLMVWFSFMGIAIGFREKLHLAMDSFTNLLPKRFNRVLDKIILVCVFAFGLYLVKNGWAFTVLMNESTLPATKLPNSIMYLVMPITGIMICVYTFLQLIGIETIRHQNIDEEVPKT
ncbi:TRAP transporter small permease [Paenibacillus harenae]|uniref:TRAP-type C4-dicarboxylate transport system permease small subunit n=1 Tax=Paenibacillus harenae TaxID=306543 RepID=A0ABT9U7C6_PAEHA|nr:TRAP transporter small permease [Paenibacillus harenae]MDQ0115549.1 TRAP-type C4-dicarboxylate transport system permease small subunit [Paenibacillus harenae]